MDFVATLAPQSPEGSVARMAQDIPTPDESEARLLAQAPGTPEANTVNRGSGDMRLGWLSIRRTSTTAVASPDFPPDT